MFAWTWGHGTPFRDGQYAVIDSMRVVCIVFAVVSAYLIARLAWNREERPFPTYVRAVLIALTAYDVQAVFTEIGKLGSPVSWRLPANLLGAIYATVAAAQMLRLRGMRVRPKRLRRGRAGS